jgi:hypothetical protein
MLKANGKVMPHRSSRPLTVAEVHSPTEIKKQSIFDGLIKRRWGTSINPPKQTDAENLDNKEFEEHEDEDEPKRVMPDIEDTVDATGKLLNQQPACDRILHSEASLQMGESMTVGRATKQALGPDGTVAGAHDENPCLNVMIYEVEFPDGTLKEPAASATAENVPCQVDSDGFSLTVMKAITDYQNDDAAAVPKTNKHVITPSGQKRMRKTTVGWSLLVKWADGSESWMPLKDLKESHPIEMAEFAKARGIADEPAFAWWAPHRLRKRDVMLSKIKARIRKTTHKHGIETPSSLEHADEINRRNSKPSGKMLLLRK